MAGPAAAHGGPAAAGGALPERAGVAWRRLVDARALRARGRLWTVSTAAHTVPFVATAGILVGIEPGLAPVSALALVHAWAIPELYANRGAKVLRPARRRDDRAESTALGLLGDLVGHEARALHSRTGLVPERGRLGVWLVGEAGALLVRACRRPVAALGRPDGPPAAGPARGRDGVRHRGQPRLQRRHLARAAAAGTGDAARAERRGADGTRLISTLAVRRLLFFGQRAIDRKPSCPDHASHDFRRASRRPACSSHPERFAARPTPRARPGLRPRRRARPPLPLGPPAARAARGAACRPLLAPQAATRLTPIDRNNPARRPALLLRGGGPRS